MPITEPAAEKLEGVSVDTTVLEARSIDPIPESERHGKVSSQFTLWFGTNIELGTALTGSAAVVAGATPLYAILGVLLGNLLGGIVMALHAVQGPRLGLPQMISSRAQFGVRGAALPLVLTLLMYLGFAATDCALAGQALSDAFELPLALGVGLFAVASGVVAIVGYRLVHVMGRVASVVGLLFFGYLTVRILLDVPLGSLLSSNGFQLGPFVVAVSLAASWQLVYGPYVADYSRYLPAGTSSKAVFGATLSGTVIGSQLAMMFGVVAAAVVGNGFVGHEVGYVVRLGGLGALAMALYLAVVFGKITANSLNIYGGFMSVLTAVGSFRPLVRVSQRLRVVCIAVLTCGAALLAIAGSGDFLTLFSAMLSYLLLAFVPWSAINLVDFYFLAHRYDVPALYDANGRYGSYSWIAIGTYVFGFLVQLPFFSAGGFTGWFYAGLGDVDISWLVGLGLSAPLYWLLRRYLGPSGGDGGVTTRVAGESDAAGTVGAGRDIA
jgi:NCS1 family nucleobase:cation symporter-1